MVVVQIIDVWRQRKVEHYILLALEVVLVLTGQDKRPKLLPNSLCGTILLYGSPSIIVYVFMEC